MERLGRNTYRIKPRLMKVEFLNPAQAALVKNNSWLLAKDGRFDRVFIKADESMETRNAKWQKKSTKEKEYIGRGSTSSTRGDTNKSNDREG